VSGQQPDEFPIALPPIPLDYVAPIYPPSALRAGVVGTVILMVRVDAGGRLTAIDVLRSVASLDQAAMRAIRQVRWKPAQEEYGHTIPGWAVEPVRFSFADSVCPRSIRPTTKGNMVLRPDSIMPSAQGQRRLRALLHGHLHQLQALGSRRPSAADAPVRQRIIREADHLDSPPAIPPHALNSLAQADSLLGRAAEVPSAAERRRLAEKAAAEAGRAMQGAPWWNTPYRALARALELLQQQREAALNFEICSAGEWDMVELQEVRRTIRELRSGRALQGSP
jgi:TonB family protein